IISFNRGSSMQSIDVYVVGGGPEQPEQSIGQNWPVVPRPIWTGVPTLANFPGTPWAKRLAEGEGEIVALATDGGPSIQATSMLAWMTGPADAARVMIDHVDPGKGTYDPTTWPSLG